MLWAQTLRRRCGEISTKLPESLVAAQAVTGLQPGCCSVGTTNLHSGLVEGGKAEGMRLGSYHPRCRSKFRCNDKQIRLRGAGFNERSARVVTPQEYCSETNSVTQARRAVIPN